jgi:hypothetical protein
MIGLSYQASGAWDKDLAPKPIILKMSWNTLKTTRNNYYRKGVLLIKIHC